MILKYPRQADFYLLCKPRKNILKSIWRMQTHLPMNYNNNKPRWFRYMNAFDKHRKSCTAWCEDCDEVFDKLWIANIHQDSTGHRIKATEFWITGRR
jgi:hypothetical protein